MSKPNKLFIVCDQDGGNERLISAPDGVAARRHVSKVRRAKAEEVASLLGHGAKVEFAGGTAAATVDDRQLGFPTIMGEATT